MLAVLDSIVEQNGEVFEVAVYSLGLSFQRTSLLTYRRNLMMAALILR
jgi:hypothetical protein